MQSVVEADLFCQYLANYVNYNKLSYFMMQKFKTHYNPNVTIDNKTRLIYINSYKKCIFQFVAHPNVQQLLASIWYEGLPGFRQMNMILQVHMQNINMQKYAQYNCIFPIVV